MLGYVLKRTLATIPVMAFVALFVFSLLYIAPGDPAAVIAGDQASPEDVPQGFHECAPAARRSADADEFPALIADRQVAVVEGQQLGIRIDIAAQLLLLLVQEGY